MQCAPIICRSRCVVVVALILPAVWRAVCSQALLVCPRPPRCSSVARALPFAYMPNPNQAGPPQDCAVPGRTPPGPVASSPAVHFARSAPRRPAGLPRAAPPLVALNVRAAVWVFETKFVAAKRARATRPAWLGSCLLPRRSAARAARLPGPKPRALGACDFAETRKAPERGRSSPGARPGPARPGGPRLPAAGRPPPPAKRVGSGAPRALATLAVRVRATARAPARGDGCAARGLGGVLRRPAPGGRGAAPRAGGCWLGWVGRSTGGQPAALDAARPGRQEACGAAGPAAGAGLPPPRPRPVRRLRRSVRGDRFVADGDPF